MNYNFGSYPTMITPYRADGSVDLETAKRYVRWYAENNCDGIFAVCQSSEIFYLSVDERVELNRTVYAAAKEEAARRGRPMTVVSSGHVADTVEEQADELTRIAESGTDALIWITNRLDPNNEGDDVWIKNAEALLKKLPQNVNLGLYECPYPYKRLMSPETLRQCALDGRLKFLKDTCCRIDDIRAKLAAVEGLGLKIYNANSATLLESLEAGCAGFSGVMANFHPEIYSWLCKNFRNEPEKAKEVQAFLAFASLAECQYYPVNAKYHMGLCGLGIGYDARVKDASLFTEGNKKEIEQMFTVEQIFKKLFNIQ